MSYKARVDKLYSKSIGDVSSEVIVTKGDKVLSRRRVGVNAQVIRIALRF